MKLHSYLTDIFFNTTLLFRVKNLPVYKIPIFCTDKILNFTLLFEYTIT